MKRAVVFAHYDKDNIIDDYVIYYLNALKEICSKIIFVSCRTLDDSERLKLEGIADYIIAEPHNEYDFGSYKRGFSYLKGNGLEDFDELVFVNDSVYGPFYSLKNIFETMKGCVFWGITKNNFGYKKNAKHFFVQRPHIQSYFMVFGKNVFNSKFFSDFILSIEEEKNKKSVISKYEIGLSEMLSEKGFKFNTFINAYGRINNITILKWYQIITRYNMPFLKCSLPRLKNKINTTVQDYPSVIKAVSDYPVDLIENNVERTKVSSFSKCSAPVNVKRFLFNILSEMPFIIRKPISIFIQKCLPYFND